MKKPIIVLIALFLLVPVQAQTINLSDSHNKLPYPPLYILDGLEISSEEFVEWNLDIQCVRKIKLETTETRRHCGIVHVYTRLLIVFNDRVLDTRKDRIKTLSNLERDSISIKKIDKQEAVNIYGKKGKYGALIIKTKNATAFDNY